MGNNHFAMASEWMVNGNISEYIQNNRDVNRFELVWSHSCCRPRLLLIFPPHSSGTLLGG